MVSMKSKFLIKSAAEGRKLYKTNSTFFNLFLAIKLKISAEITC
jgi:hypothetical protein